MVAIEKHHFISDFNLYNPRLRVFENFHWSSDIFLLFSLAFVHQIPVEPHSYLPLCHTASKFSSFFLELHDWKIIFLFFQHQAWDLGAESESRLRHYSQTSRWWFKLQSWIRKCWSSAGNLNSKFHSFISRLLEEQEATPVKSHL